MQRLNPSTIRLLMTGDAVGGVWRYAMAAGGELRRRGAAVALVGMGPRPAAAQEREAREAGMDLIWLDRELDWQATGRAAVEACAAALDDVIRQWSPTVLHVNGAPIAAALKPRLPCVVAAHSCLATWWSAVKPGPLPADWEWHKEMTRQGYAAADRVITPTQAFAQATTAIYGDLPHLTVVANGGAPIVPAAKQPFALAVGRWWDEGKGAARLIDAAARTRHPIFAAGPVGGSGAAAQTGTIRWLGELGHGEVGRWLAEASIFVSPALYEPFGLAALEAAHAGAALVLSDIPSFRELWDGSAVFVDPRDAAGFAAAIDQLMDDQPRRAFLTDAARLRARRLTIPHQVDRLLEAYAAAVAAHCRAA